MELEEYRTSISQLDSPEKQLGFIQKFIFHGTPKVFENREEDYFEFRNRIANKFSVGFHEVFIVGSAKLGFSGHKGTTFSYDSDIDVVIVNEHLFEKFFLKISEYQYQLDRHHRTIDLIEIRKYNSFLRYLVKGWMRPDKLPTSFQIDLLKSEWFDFFNSISYQGSEVGNYKVAAGLYKSYEYLEKYYIKSVEQQHNSLANN